MENGSQRSRPNTAVEILGRGNFANTKSRNVGHTVLPKLQKRRFGTRRGVFSTFLFRRHQNPGATLAPVLRPLGALTFARFAYCAIYKYIQQGARCGFPSAMYLEHAKLLHRCNGFIFRPILGPQIIQSDPPPSRCGVCLPNIDIFWKTCRIKFRDCIGKL